MANGIGIFSLVRVCVPGGKTKIDANMPMHGRVRAGHSLARFESPRLADGCCIHSQFALKCAWHWFTGPHCWLVQVPWCSTVALMIVAHPVRQWLTLCSGLPLHSGVLAPAQWLDPSYWGDEEQSLSGPQQFEPLPGPSSNGCATSPRTCQRPGRWYRGHHAPKGLLAKSIIIARRAQWETQCTSH